MRVVFWILSAAAILAGLAFGALNSARVTIDLYLGHATLPLGGALLLALLLGTALGGGCVWLLRVWPLSSALRRSQQAKPALNGKRSGKKPTAA